MSQGNWGGGGPGGGYGPPPGGGGYGQPPGGQPPGGGGYGPPPGGGGYGPPPGPGGGFAPPPAGYPPGYTPDAAAAAGVVPWEDQSIGLFARWWATTKAELFGARAFYAKASQSDNPMTAITYSVMCGVMLGFAIGLTVGVIYLVAGGIGAAAASSAKHGSSGPGGGAIVAMMGAMGVFAIIVYPIMLGVGGFIGPWINGGIYHLTLMIFKGANKSYMHTVRVVAYSHAAQVWMMIPFVGYMLGWLPAAVFAIMGLVVGLDETHKCGTGKAVAAVFLIPGLLCLCCCGLYAAIFASVLSAGHH